MNTEKLKSLIGVELTGFRIVEMIEVYRVDEQGLNPVVLGYFKDATVAAVFAGPQTNDNQTRTQTRLVLTNGMIGYLMELQEPVKLFNDEEEAAKLKTAALNLLSPEQKKLLGLA